MKLKDIVNDTKLALTTLAVGRALDHVSTIDFVNRLGIEHEVNERIRYVYENFGYLRGYLPLEIVTLGIVAGIGLSINYLCKKNKSPINMGNVYLYSIGTISVITGFKNFCQSNNF